MTPEEVFDQLRDIHEPDVAVEASYLLNPWPLVIFLGIAACMFLLPHVARWRRRQAFRARIAAISDEPPRKQIDAMISLLPELPPSPANDPAPDVLFGPTDRTTPDDLTEIRRWLMRRAA